MQTKKSWPKVLSTTAFVMLSLTVVITLLSGIGTTCVALNPARMNMTAVQTQLQILVLISILDGIAGVWSLIHLWRGKPGIYRIVLIILAVGLITSGIQMVYSATYRNGATAPNNFRVYITAITLFIFLLLSIPGIKDKINLDKMGGRGGGSSLVGSSLFLTGMAVLTTPLWAGPTHMFDGFNMVNLIIFPLLGCGFIMTISGLMILFPSLPTRIQHSLWQIIRRPDQKIILPSDTSN